MNEKKQNDSSSVKGDYEKKLPTCFVTSILDKVFKCLIYYNLSFSLKIIILSIRFV